MSGKVLITGGFGNLGSWITLHLASLGYDIYVLTRKEKHKFENIKYSVIECDITNLDELKEELNFDIDFCIHTASFNEFFLPNYSQNALAINTLGTRNILEVLSTKNLKNFIYFSTFHVYGIQSGIIDENTLANPKNDYASTHLFAEYYVKQFACTHNLKYTIFRLTNSYGAPTFCDTTKWYLVLNDLVKSAYENNKIILKSNGRVKRDFIWMGDVSNIVHYILQINATNDIYNLSSNKYYKIIELANIVKKVYIKRYNKDIEIQINNSDKTIYEDINVKNDKLKYIINFEINDMFEDEINKIFNILEEK
ncbi:MAG: NAD-dependent epimerase/dehydratase family protein [Arcobacteraceae bacterium]|nr:NAD-dependent epimerase/dehydratase family protein [Arcobacteraceae bacterium]